MITKTFIPWNHQAMRENEGKKHILAQRKYWYSKNNVLNISQMKKTNFFYKFNTW